MEIAIVTDVQSSHIWFVCETCVCLHKRWISLCEWCKNPSFAISIPIRNQGGNNGMTFSILIMRLLLRNDFKIINILYIQIDVFEMGRWKCKRVSWLNAHRWMDVEMEHVSYKKKKSPCREMYTFAIFQLIIGYSAYQNQFYSPSLIRLWVYQKSVGGIKLLRFYQTIKNSKKPIRQVESNQNLSMNTHTSLLL
jgi:hypothetical protein